MSVTLRKRALLLVLLSLSIFSSCSRERTKSVSGTVVKIADGDTITILDAQNVQHKIRLQGIDAPERRQDFGAVSREHLGSLVFGKHVRVEYEKVDKYGRLVGKVWIDGNDECLEQLKAGLAWHYKDYEKEQPPADRQLYASAEQEARGQKRGLWKDPTPTPPWDFRHHTNGSNAETDLEREPVPANHQFNNSSPSVDRYPTSAPTPIPAPPTNVSTSDEIRGNKRTMIYFWRGCPNYEQIAPRNRIPFASREAAERAGYRAARNCP